MKRLLFILPLLVFLSCSDDDKTENENTCTEDTSSVSEYKPIFPTDDGSEALAEESDAENLYLLLKKAEPSHFLTLKALNITDKELEEIILFSQKLSDPDKGATEQITYELLFEWINKNLKYGHAGNDPYKVFINRESDCQGYSNLLRTMLISMNIPAFGVNGFLGNYGAHAWLYVYADGKWIVSDPTNGEWNFAQDIHKYKDALMPKNTDVELFEDNNFLYNFYEGCFNISEIKKIDEVVTVPYSAEKIKLTSFNPSTVLPASVRTIVLGKNIRTLGKERLGLSSYGNNVEMVYIDPENEFLESYYGIVYDKSSGEILYIPQKLESITLKPQKEIGKNFILNHNFVKEIRFSEGTEVINDYAIENCNNLRRAYMPKSVKQLANNAFVNVAKDFEIIFE